MSSLRSLLSAIGTLFSGAARNRRLAASRLDGLGLSKIRAGAAKVATDFDIIDLASGAPAFSTPEELKGKAVEAILGDHNQYSDPAGDRELRQLIAVQTGRTVNEVTITSGTSAALAGVLLALVEQGDEVIVFAPFFESYSSAIRLAGATPRYVTLKAPDWTLDEAALRAAFSKRTRAVIVNSPHNPTGRVFSKTELELVAQLCEEHEAFLIGDEIYSKLTFDVRRSPRRPWRKRFSTAAATSSWTGFPKPTTRPAGASGMSLRLQRSRNCSASSTRSWDCPRRRRCKSPPAARLPLQ